VRPFPPPPPPQAHRQRSPPPSLHCPCPSPQSRPEFGPRGLPLLPKINSRDVEIRVFTHRSFAARPTHVFEDSPEDPSPDNEQFSVSLSITACPPPPLTISKRLEHVGDQVLGLIVTDLLQSEYPYLRVGPSTVRIVFSCAHIHLIIETVVFLENAGARRWQQHTCHHVRRKMAT
jgi:hypothetical protein